MAFSNDLTERIILGDETVGHIVLDSSDNSIQLWDGNTIVGEWRAPDNAFDVAFRLAVGGDTDARFIIRGDGAHLWGPGNAGQDIVLYRDGGGALHLQGAMDIDFGLTVGAGGIGTTDLAASNNISASGVVSGAGVSAFNALTLGANADVEYPPGRQVFFMVEQKQANASAALAFPNAASATTPTLIPGCSIQLTVTKAVNEIEITPVAWCRNTNFGAGVAFVGTLMVDGVANAVTMPLQTSAANSRFPMTRPYTFTNLSIGTHTFELWGNLSIVPGVTGYSMEQALSTIKGRLFE